VESRNFHENQVGEHYFLKTILTQTSILLPSTLAGQLAQVS